MDLQCYYVNFFKENKKVLQSEGSSPQKPPIENVQKEPIAKDNECVVCLEKEKEVVFIPCRHLGTCKNCAINLRHCPVCRTIVLQTVVVFKC
jgi:baculoviral IAP repeat-containing protein 7/8